MITAGIDCGARNTKTVLMAAGRIVGRGRIPTGFDPAGAVAASLHAALEDAGRDRRRIEARVATGAGRAAAAVDARVDDIRTLARGAVHFFPGARTAIDVGAEDARAARIDESGAVEDFVVNERCAAGAGTFIEAMARALETPIEEMGPLALESQRAIPMNAQCVVFAESEVVRLIADRTPRPDISRAVHDAMAGRIAAMVRRLGLREDVVLLGGLGANPGFVDALRRQLEGVKIAVPPEPEFGSAVGAALLAAEIR